MVGYRAFLSEEARVYLQQSQSREINNTMSFQEEQHDQAPLNGINANFTLYSISTRGVGDLVENFTTNTNQAKAKHNN